LPQLNFVERSCIQCGTCEKACPEDAISLDTRFLYDDKERGAQRLLHEEQPACCISCGKPFATHSMLKVMAKKLEDHWMFQSDADRRRLEMCEGRRPGLDPNQADRHPGTKCPVLVRQAPCCGRYCSLFSDFLSVAAAALFD
jgi:ferredoxin